MRTRARSTCRSTRAESAGRADRVARQRPQTSARDPCDRRSRPISIPPAPGSTLTSGSSWPLLPDLSLVSEPGLHNMYRRRLAVNNRESAPLAEVPHPSERSTDPVLRQRYNHSGKTGVRLTALPHSRSSELDVKVDLIAIVVEIGRRNTIHSTRHVDEPLIEEIGAIQGPVLCGRVDDLENAAVNVRDPAAKV